MLDEQGLSVENKKPSKNTHPHFLLQSKFHPVQPICVALRIKNIIQTGDQAGTGSALLNPMLGTLADNGGRLQIGTKNAKYR